MMSKLTFLGFEPYNSKTDDEHVHFTVIMARFENKWIFVQHKRRTTLEAPGGKREPNESLLACARRELREESGAVIFALRPLRIYSVRDEKTGIVSSGLLCFARVTELGPLPESEISNVYLIKTCPTDMTYPTILPHIFDYVTRTLSLS